MKYAEIRRQLLRPGTVFTFTKDVSQVKPSWRDRRPGVHFISDGTAGYYQAMTARNTLTGKRDLFNFDDLAHIRVIGNVNGHE